jgi:hypothetical protein
MTAHTDQKRRDQLAYLALYYAIAGNEKRSEQLRRVVRRLETQPNVETAMVPAQAL